MKNIHSVNGFGWSTAWYIVHSVHSNITTWIRKKTILKSKTEKIGC